MQDRAKHRKTEWACRILLTIQLLRIVSGYMAEWQTRYQLTSPLISQKIISEIVSYWWMPCLLLSFFFLLAMWLYFVQKQVAVIVVSSVSIIGFEIWIRTLVT